MNYSRLSLTHITQKPHGEGMAKIAKQAMDEDNYVLAGAMFKELAKYYAPTMKSVEFKGEMDTKNVSEIQVNIEVRDVTSSS